MYYADKNYSLSMLELFKKERTSLGHTKIVSDWVYNNMVKLIVDSTLSKEEQVYALVSWDLASFWFSRNGMHDIKEVEKLHEKVSKLELLPKECGSMFAKAIQSLKIDKHYTEFIEG